jgi:hypothetical protein
MVDLPLVLNLSEQIPALRRVRALDELLMLDLPPLAAGTTLTGDLVLCDGDGVDQDITGTTPLLVISRFAADGPEILAIVSDFVQANAKKWTFSLPLLSEPLLTYLGQAGESKEAVFEVSQASAGLVRLLYRRAVTLMAAAYDPSGGTTPPTVPPAYPQLQPSITTPAELRAAVTVGATLPVVYLVLFSGWECYTLRARLAGEEDDGVTYILPDDWNADTNNVIWVKTAIS